MSGGLCELHLAISCKNLNHVKCLMKDRLVLDRMWLSEMPVGRAVYNCAYDILEYLVKIGAEVNVRSKNDRMEPPLFAACRLKIPQAVRILLQSPNLNIDQRDFFNRTPLWAAVHCSSLEIVELLLDHGANITAAQDFTGCPLLLSLKIFQRNRCSKIPYLLIQRGCLLDFKNSEGSSLFFSVVSENRKLFCLLVKAGCLVESQEWLSKDKLPVPWKNDENFCNWICSLHNNPRTLVHLTSCVIRKSLVKLHKNLFPSHIAQLNIPEILQKHLLLED